MTLEFGGGDVQPRLGDVQPTLGDAVLVEDIGDDDGDDVRDVKAGLLGITMTIWSRFYETVSAEVYG
jgi:hypothetical protein